jgi:hypothetical protein
VRSDRVITVDANPDCGTLAQRCDAHGPPNHEPGG